jgi:hypothetical protein
VLFGGIYLLYEIVRAIADGSPAKAAWNATKLINFEHLLHVFVEPSIQAWTSNRHWLMDFADWTYLNAHYIVTFGVLLFVYLRRNDSFCFVRNMFLIAMGLALVGYFLYPTAPPRMMPEWGFTDSIRQFTGVVIEHGPMSALLNFYAAVPSMHVCFAILVAWPMRKLAVSRTAKVAWTLYPLLITFVVVATGNHYLMDAVLGAVTAAAAVMSAERLARARPQAWAFGVAAAEAPLPGPTEWPAEAAA